MALHIQMPPTEDRINGDTTRRAAGASNAHQRDERNGGRAQNPTQRTVKLEHLIVSGLLIPSCVWRSLLYLHLFAHSCSTLTACKVLHIIAAKFMVIILFSWEGERNRGQERESINNIYIYFIAEGDYTTPLVGSECRQWVHHAS